MKNIPASIKKYLLYKAFPTQSFTSMWEVECQCLETALMTSWSKYPPTARSVPPDHLKQTNKLSFLSFWGESDPVLHKTPWGHKELCFVWAVWLLPALHRERNVGYVPAPENLQNGEIFEKPMGKILEASLCGSFHLPVRKAKTGVNQKRGGKLLHDETP